MSKNYLAGSDIIIVIVIILLIIIIIISFLQGIYTYIPETNHVPRDYSVSAILSLLFMVPISLVPALAVLYFHVSTYRSMCAVPNMAVFYSSFTSRFPGMLFMYFLNDFEMVPVAPIITGITLVFTFHMRCIYIVRSLLLLLFIITVIFNIIVFVIVIIGRYCRPPLVPKSINILTNECLET